jgi:MoxR-like ATPase
MNNSKLDLNSIDFSNPIKVKSDLLHTSKKESEDVKNILPELLRQIQSVVVGQETMIELAIMSLLTGGHLLLCGQPGLGKSLTLHAISQTLHVNVKHVHSTGDFIGSNLMLVDELDRTDPEFRRALLTAMQEKEIVLENELFYLDKPFSVMATVNPQTFSGESSLTPAELDRFLFYHEVPFPSHEEELQILKSADYTESPKLDPLLNARQILLCQRMIDKVKIPEKITESIVTIITETRKSSCPLPLADGFKGISPRGTLYLALASKAKAFLDGDLEVKISHVLFCCHPVLFHRLPIADKKNAEAILHEYCSGIINKII